MRDVINTTGYELSQVTAAEWGQSTFYSKWSSAQAYTNI